MKPDAAPRNAAARFLVALPYLWVALFLALPFALVAKLSVSQSVLAQPPYAPVFTWADSWRNWWEKAGTLGLAAYRGLLEDPIYLDSLLGSVRLAALATLLALVAALPLAWAIARTSPRRRPLLLTLVVAPFWTSFLIRVYALGGLIKNDGPLERALAFLHLIDPPLDLYATQGAIVLGIAYSYLPFMVLPIYNSLEKQDDTLIEAARDLGAGPLAAFRTITLPLAMPGVLAGSALVFIPATGEVVIPDLLGGSDTLMIGRTLWNDFFGNRDWPAASATACLLAALLLAPIWFFERDAARGSRK